MLKMTHEEADQFLHLLDELDRVREYRQGAHMNTYEEFRLWLQGKHVCKTFADNSGFTCVHCGLKHHDDPSKRNLKSREFFDHDGDELPPLKKRKKR